MIHRQLYPTLYGILLTIPLAACGGADSNGIGEMDAGFEIRKSDGGFSVSNSLVTYYSYGANRR